MPTQAQAEEFVRSLFLEDLSTSVDQAAREVDKQVRPLPKELISKIRREIHQQIEAARKNPTPPLKGTTPTYKPLPTKEEQIAFLNHYLEENPHATLQSTLMALDNFGATLDLNYIRETIKLAKELYTPNFKAFAQHLKTYGIKKIEVFQDGSYKIELEGCL